MNHDLILQKHISSKTETQVDEFSTSVPKLLLILKILSGGEKWYYDYMQILKLFSTIVNREQQLPPQVISGYARRNTIQG